MIKSLKVPWSKKLDVRAKKLVLGAKKLDVSHLDLKGFSSYKFRPIAQIFTNRASVYPEL